MLSACWLIGAYFLAVSSHKRGRLNTSVYGIMGKKCYTTSDGLSWPFRHQRCSFLARQKVLKVYS